MSEIAAKTVFMTGPDDKVAAADIYTQVPATPVNNGETVVQSGTAPAPTPDKISVQSIAKRLPDVPKDVAARVKNVAGDVAGMSKTLVDKLKEGVSPKEGLKAVVEKGKNDLKGAGIAAGKNLIGKDTMMVIDGVKSIRKTGDFSSASGVVSILNQISNDPNFAKVDMLGDKLAVLGKAANILTKYRIDGIIDKVLDHFDRVEDKRQFLIDNFETFIKNGDLYSVKLALDTAGVIPCLARMPNAVQALITHYRLPPNVLTPTISTGNDLIGVLSRLDTHWYQYSRNGVWINNLEVFAYAGTGATETFKLYVEYRHLVIMAKQYPAMDLVDGLRTAFPKAVIR